MPAKFIIQSRGIYFSFSFEGDNENIILFSRLFRTKTLCYAGIAELKLLVNYNERFEKLNDKFGQYSFTIRNKKDIMLGHSKTFYASSARDYAMKQIMREAADAIIIESSEQQPAFY